jgi:tRNA(Ile2)-agmatinylcytidine synthase
MWLGVDDTDSPKGGCTTWVLTELLRLARERGVDLIGEPRLVRLNPNIPWKTRGNAALSARFGRGAGPRRKVGVVAGAPLWSYKSGDSLPPRQAAEFFEAAWEQVLTSSRAEDGTDPALVATPRRLPAELYRRAVQEVVPIDDAVTALDQAGGWWRVRGHHRGLVGAAASVAWPGRRVTWEVTAYRPREVWGEPRCVDAASVRRAARRHPELFLCHDPRTRRLMVTPHTPCPILYGLRGTDVSALLTARSEVRSEPVERWVLFRTNQATGDHLRPRPVRELGPYLAARIAGTVQGPPRVLAGGHVHLPVVDHEGLPVDCVAFEPTKTLPRVARALVAGDRVVVGGSRGEDATFRLETVRLVRLVPRFGPPRAPECPLCHRRARSLGTVRGFRCPSCHRRWPPEAAARARLPPAFPRGEYHPTPSARRHLHPLAPEP